MKAFVACLALGASLMLVGPATAQPRPAAGDCKAMSQAYGPQKLWWGRFSGGRKAKHSFFNDRAVEYHTAEVCFTTRKECEAWLYRMKSDWQYMPRWNECLPGYGR